MAKKIWIIKLDDVEHKIELEHGSVSGKRIIYLDGKVIEYIRYNIFDKGSKHYFIINNHRCVVLINSEFKFSYDLIIDGISAETGLPGGLQKRHRMKINKDEIKGEIIGGVFGLIGVAISSYILGLMPFGIRKSIYQIILSIIFAASFYCIYKGILFLFNIKKSR